MRLRWVTLAALLVVGGLAYDGGAESLGAEPFFTADASASCTIDEVLGCTPQCRVPEPTRPKDWTCRL